MAKPAARDDVRIEAVYFALAVPQTEGAKFWMKVFTDLKTRGCLDILIAETDGLKGMEEALAAVFPGRRCRHGSSIC